MSFLSLGENDLLVMFLHWDDLLLCCSRCYDQICLPSNCPTLDHGVRIMPHNPRCLQPNSKWGGSFNRNSKSFIYSWKYLFFQNNPVQHSYPRASHSQKRFFGDFVESGSGRLNELSSGPITTAWIFDFRYRKRKKSPDREPSDITRR
jgi:hypothetical protein